MSVQLFKKTVRLYIEKYNSYLASNGKQYNLQIHKTYYIPNNNKKMYCIVLSNIMYFFSSNGNNCDFFIKVRGVFTSDMLLEGYLYNEKDYLVSDILMVNKVIVDKEYIDRYNMIFNFDFLKLSNLNNKITLGIHDTYTEFPNEYSRSFVETITYMTKINKQVIDFCSSIVPKIVRKGRYSDVYNVFSVETNNSEGILYVKTIDLSRKLRLFFERECDDDTDIIINCKWNSVFSKFEPLSNLE